MTPSSSIRRRATRSAASQCRNRYWPAPTRSSNETAGPSDACCRCPRAATGDQNLAPRVVGSGPRQGAMALSCRNWILSDGNVAFEVRPVTQSICQGRTILDALVRAHPPRVIFTPSAWPRNSLGPADGSHLPAASAAAEETIAAIALEPDTPVPGRHLEFLQNLSRSRIDAPHFALVALPGAMPELAVDPGDAGDDAVTLDRAQDRSCLRIDLVDLPAAVLPHPERAFSPGQPGVAAVAGAGIVASTRPVFGSIFWMRSSAI